MSPKSRTAFHGLLARLTSGRNTRGESGASLVEYALLVALIALVCITAVALFGGETGDTFSRVASEVEKT